MRVAVALGSNLGDRAAHLEFAAAALARVLAALRISRWYDTEPVIGTAEAVPYMAGHTAGTAEPAPSTAGTDAGRRVRGANPVGAAQPRFLNGAAVGETTLSARELLQALLALERERGRERPFPGAPRTLDLDLVLFGDQVLNEPGLIVPHPRFRERRFVLEPLAEIASDMVDPATGKTVRELFRSLDTLQPPRA